MQAIPKGENRFNGVQEDSHQSFIKQLIQGEQERKQIRRQFTAQGLGDSLRLVGWSLQTFVGHDILR